MSHQISSKIGVQWVLGEHKNIVLLRLVRAMKAFRAMRMVRTLRLFKGLRLLVCLESGR